MGSGSPDTSDVPIKSAVAKIVISLVIIVMIILLLILFKGDRKKVITTGPSLYSEKIVIGTETWPGYIGLYVARDMGYFEEAGLDVEIKRYVGLGDLSRDYRDGKMQGRANITLDAVSETMSGMDHRIVTVIDYSAGSDAIVAVDGINDVQDLKGEKVAYEIGTLTEFFIAWMLQEYGLSLDDVIHIDANPEEAALMLLSGDVSAAVSQEPFLTELLQGSIGQDVHVLYSSEDAPGLITDVLTLRTDFIERYPETVQAIVGAYFKGINYLLDDPEQAHMILAKEFDTDLDSIEGQLVSVDVLDLPENREAFFFSSGIDSIFGHLHLVSRFIREHRESEMHIDTEILVDDSFIKNLYDGIYFNVTN